VAYRGSHRPGRFFCLNQINVAYFSDAKTTLMNWKHVAPSVDGAFHHVLPRVAISPSGVVTLLYYEDTLTLNPLPLTARYLAATASGQPAWGTPLTLSVPFRAAFFSSGGKFVPTMFNQVGDTFIGDYVGLTFDPAGNALATWADGREDRSDIYFKKCPGPPSLSGCP